MPPRSPNASLFAAIKVKSLPKINAAIALGADLNSENCHQPPQTPLELAATVGSKEVFTALLAAGSTIRNPETILDYAIGGKSLAVLEQVLDVLPPSCHRWH
jgi:ankyrin repeat protein